MEGKYCLVNIQRLRQFSITGKSSEMRQRMLDEKFILEDIALLGQWTTIYASPNTGKTLLTLWLLKQKLDEAVLDSDFVFYVNSDDNYRGIVEKTELAEEWGFHMIAPNQNNFNNNEIVSLMTDLAKSDEANGVVIILDTLKKFVDLMHKKEASDFGKISRGFVAAGGTLICLAHTNKHKDSEGKSVYSGTSDIRDDSDCTYILEKLDGSVFQSEVLVEFVNDKNRGNNLERVSFSYSKGHAQKYADLIASIRRVDGQEVSKLRTETKNREKLELDQDAINAISKAIRAGITSKSSIVKNVNQETGLSHKDIRTVLDERTGSFYDAGHRWEVCVGRHNKSAYTILNPFSTVEGNR